MDAAALLEDLLDEAPRHLEGVLEGTQGEVLPTLARERLDALRPAAPAYRQGGNRQNFEYALPGAALYAALRELAGDDLADPVAPVQATMEAVARARLEGSAAARLALRLCARSRLAARMMERSMLALDEPDGWRAEPTDGDAHVAFDMVECGVVTFLHRAGLVELAPAFCALDHVGAAFMPGLTLQRTTTLAEGGERCDFRYVRTR